MTSFSSHPDEAKSVSIWASTSTSPSCRIVLTSVLMAVIFAVSAASSVNPFGVSVPSPKMLPKMMEGSMARMMTGRSIATATIPIIPFLLDLAAPRAAPCIPPVAAPFAILEMVFPVFAAARIVPAALSCWDLFSSSIIRYDPFSWVQAGVRRQCGRNTQSCRPSLREASSER